MSVRPPANRTSGIPFTSCSRPALQIDPESSAVDHLKINMPPAHIRVIENDVSPRVATDHRKRLMQQPQFAFVRALTLDDELE